MRPKINWCSPLPPAKSSIAHDYSATLLPLLREHADVTVWCEQHHEVDAEFADDVEFFTPEKCDWRKLHSGVPIYQIGNNIEYHAGIWEIARRCPGVIVLHDTRLQHLVAGIHREQRNDRANYRRINSRFHGALAMHVGDVFWDHGASTEFIAAQFPLTEAALENALGGVVHSRTIFEQLAAKKRWPLLYLPLPYRAAPRAQQREKCAPFRIVTFGYIGPNRQIDVLLRALHAYERREQFRLDIYGEFWRGNRIPELIAELGLDSIVKLHGFVSTETLNDALDNASLGVNLRWPSMGEASATLLHMWSRALPALVTRTGWYAEQSDDAVCFIEPRNEIRDIHRNLDALLANPLAFAVIGENGRRILECDHDPANYARAITDFAVECAQMQPRVAAFQMTQRAAAVLDACDVSPENPLLQNVAREIAALTIAAARDKSQQST